ncbi:MAG TPA: hypothetical protein VKQ72_13480, partial [Aggregatilineales bacterium]|nr:hypothetical protein [Aggregatilineales bacterium]
LNLANQWATQRTADMTTFHDIARSMLIPPMATDALARVMLAGVVACAIALTLFYVPRALRTMRHGPGLRAVFAGSAALVAILIAVSGVAVADSLTTPTIQENTIARELPATVSVYAGLNLQELFLKNTQRPLEAILQAAQVFLAPVSTPAPVAAPGTDSQPAQSAQSQASQPSQPVAAASASTPVDDVIRALLRARNWSAASYKPFCPDEEPPENWQGCFANSLLSWVGPQSAFAMMPAINGGSDLDFLFAFQATNRNNAIGFATNLATALGEAEPVQSGPNVRLMTINGGTADERRLAITQAYVLIGTPRAIQATLEHGQDTLAAQVDFRAVTADLPTGDFATLYVRANSFHGDLEPALKDILSMEAIDSTMQIASAGSLLSFVRTRNSPAVIGLSLRADEQQITVDGVANMPYDLQKLDASAVGDSLLNRVPAEARSWAALNVDVAGLVGGVSVPGLLGKALPGNIGFVQGILGDFGQSLQKLMGYAKGGMMITELPVQASQAGGQQSGQGRTEIGLVVPMLDRGAGEILPALKAITGRLQMIGGLSGAIQVQIAPATPDRGEIITLSGAALQGSLPTGLQYTLTKDSILILTTGHGLDNFLASFKEAQKGAANKMHAVLDGPLDRFVYAYADLSPRSIPLTAVFGGQVRRQAVYVTLVLKAQ